MADLSVQGQSVTVTVAVAVAVDSNPLHPAPHRLLPLKSCLHQSQLAGHIAADADVTTQETSELCPPKHTPPARPQTHSSYYHYHRSPRPSRAAVWILSLYRTRGCSSAVYDFERVVASAALGTNNPPSSSSQREAHHASDKGAFLPRVLIEPDLSATTTWALLEPASWCENG